MTTLQSNKLQRWRLLPHVIQHLVLRECSKLEFFSVKSGGRECSFVDRKCICNKSVNHCKSFVKQKWTAQSSQALWDMWAVATALAFITLGEKISVCVFLCVCLCAWLRSSSSACAKCFFIEWIFPGHQPYAGICAMSKNYTWSINNHFKSQLNPRGSARHSWVRHSWNASLLRMEQECGTDSCID